MKLLPRFHTAIILTVVYTLIILGSLAPPFLKAVSAARPTSGHCTEDCRSCGCSAESMANRTCCCLKKQQARADGVKANPAEKSPNRKQTTISACGCPIGDDEHALLAVSEISEMLPCSFTMRFAVPESQTRYPQFTTQVTSHQSEPPVPPPKIFVV